MTKLKFINIRPAAFAIDSYGKGNLGTFSCSYKKHEYFYIPLYSLESLEQIFSALYPLLVKTEILTDIVLNEYPEGHDSYLEARQTAILTSNFRQMFIGTEQCIKI